ncbi:MAG: ABC transporter permease [Gemmatimonadota bacterium]
MDQLLQDIRFAIRTLVKAPIFTTLCVVCLAIGIGLNANIYGAVYAVFQRPFPYADPERLVSLDMHQTRGGFNNQTMPFETFQDLQAQTTAFDQLAASTFRSVTITDGDEPVRIQGQAVTWNLLPMLGVRPMLGRHMRPDEDVVGAAPVILLGYGLWQRRYAGDSAIVGRVLPVNGQPHTVIGVMPQGFKFPEQEEAWIPAAPLLDGHSRQAFEVMVLGRLKAGVDLSAADAQVAASSERQAKVFPEALGEWRATVKPIRDTFIDTDTKTVIAAMFGAVTFVLLIACANVANLLLARAAGRNREIAVRAALGAGRGRIVRQLLTESVILALIACPIGIGIAYWLLDVIKASIPEGDMPYFIVFQIDGPVLIYTVLVAVLTGLIFGMAPALQAVRGNLQGALKDGGRGSGTGGGRHRLRTVLAVGEIALSLVLLVGAALFVKSFLNLRTKNGGIEVDRLLTLRFFMPGERYDSARAMVFRTEDVIRRIEALPGVVWATASNNIPLSGGGGGAALEIEGKPLTTRADAPFVRWAGVTSHWFETLGVPIIAGRTITDLDARSSPWVAVVNETMARQFWRDADPLGRRFRIAGDTAASWFTVIGVSRDYKVDELSDAAPISAVFAVPHPHMATRNTGVTILTLDDPLHVAAAVRKAVHDSDPTIPVFDMMSMEQRRQLGFWSVRLFGWMFAMFGIVALVLASVGVYGVIAYGVSQRTQEIGVRVALGAQPSDVIRLVVGNGAKLAAAGVLLGLVGALGLTRVIQSLLIDVSATDPVSFVGVTLFLTTVALVASYVPARRATRVDPLTALRAE